MGCAALYTDAMSLFRVSEDRYPRVPTVPPSKSKIDVPISVIHSPRTYNRFYDGRKVLARRRATKIDITAINSSAIFLAGRVKILKRVAARFAE